MLPAMEPTIEVLDGERLLSFTFADLMRYHGPGSPGGVAHAFKVLERGLPLLAGGEPPQRREIELRTAFGGPGARDGVELVTRAVTGERYVVDRSLARPERGRTRANFVFELTYRETTVTLALREGFVTDEFIDMIAKQDKTPADDARFVELKDELAARVMGATAGEVYELA
jgi:hypothetical protein